MIHHNLAGVNVGSVIIFNCNCRLLEEFILYINILLSFLMYSPCRGNLNHHLGSLQSDLGSIGLLVLNLSCVNDHLLFHRNTLLSASLDGERVFDAC